MIFTTILLFGALGYLVYTSKKELTPNDILQENSNESDDLTEGLDDLFI